MNIGRRAALTAVCSSIVPLGGCAELETRAETAETPTEPTRAATTAEVGDPLEVKTLHFSSSGERCPDDPQHAAHVQFSEQRIVRIEGTTLFSDTCSLLDPEVYLPTTTGTGHAIVEIRKSDVEDQLGPCRECVAEREYTTEIEFNRHPDRVSVVHSPPGDMETTLVATNRWEG